MNIPNDRAAPPGDGPIQATGFVYLAATIPTEYDPWLKLAGAFVLPDDAVTRLKLGVI
ncbi:MAG TPA: hypothetical protein VHO69_03480 [Phototrophicaceae bacterium]|nr:hypothetical protein [Phototrophicaceae bacterium]